MYLLFFPRYSCFTLEKGRRKKMGNFFTQYQQLEQLKSDNENLSKFVNNVCKPNSFVGGENVNINIDDNMKWLFVKTNLLKYNPSIGLLTLDDLSVKTTRDMLLSACKLKLVQDLFGLRGFVSFTFAQETTLLTILKPNEILNFFYTIVSLLNTKSSNYL